MISKIKENKKELGKLKIFFASLLEKQILSILILLVISFITFAGLTLMSTYMHERVHGAINIQYGMDNEYGYKMENGLLMAYTRAIVPEGYTFSDLCDETCTTLHMQNEILTYNLDGLINIIFALFIIGCCYYHTKNFNLNAFTTHMEEWEKEEWKKKEFQALKQELQNYKKI